MFLYLIVSNLLFVPLYAQSGNISGTVTDSSRRGILVGAQVQVEGQPFVTSTDESGKYVLLGIPAGNAPIANVFVPGCSTAQEGFSCEWRDFHRAVQAAIDPAFVH